MADVAGHPVLVHPAGVVFAVDLGSGVAVLQPAGLVVTWRELPGDLPAADVAVAVRAAFRQAGRLSG